MTVNDIRLRDRIRAEQVSDGMAAPLLQLLYYASDRLREELPPNRFYEPLLTLERDGSATWSGKFMSEGPFGIRDVIGFNLARFRTADDMLITLAHELAHWSCQDTAPGHSEEWQYVLRDRLGIVCSSDGSYRYHSGKWMELEQELNVEAMKGIRVS